MSPSVAESLVERGKLVIFTQVMQPGRKTLTFINFVGLKLSFDRTGALGFQFCGEFHHIKALSGN